MPPRKPPKPPGVEKKKGNHEGVKGPRIDPRVYRIMASYILKRTLRGVTNFAVDEEGYNMDLTFIEKRSLYKRRTNKVKHAHYRGNTFFAKSKCRVLDKISTHDQT